MLQGKKTYLVGICAALYGIFGLLSGNMDANSALAIIVPAVLAMTVRHGIANQ